MRELKAQRIWFLWRKEMDGDRINKVPFAAGGGATGTSEKYRHTWVTYDEAVAAAKTVGAAGVGFVVPEEYFFLDIDHADLDDPRVQTMLSRFDSYAEYSVSGNGLHIYGKVDLRKLPIAPDKNGKPRLDKVDFTRTGKYTVEQWMDEWFENVCKIKVRPSSHQTYRGYIDHHVAPNIGKIPLEKLSTMDLQKLYRKLMNKGRVERIEAEHQPKGLSAKTVRNINQVISSAMDFAVAQKIISENPCKAVALPKLEHKEMQTIPAEQLQAFLQEAKATGVYEMYYIELATGLRRGELLGLKWQDIDWKNGIIKVRRQVARVDGQIVEAPLKTKNSYRAVSISPQAIEVLREQKRKTNDQYVFPSPNGGPISPDSVNNMLKRVLERAGIPKVRFHDLRHTFATIALQNGVDIKTVSGMLGHFSAGFTLDTYAHVTTSAQKEAAQTMGNILSL